ncbi:sulfatase family protein [Flavilitoribacter nigricans]|uniref:Sulfatase n=1 Tax=Flavilitoribacter nigricans (strain ATCC 23147 / DSM 23189 / NBRC 102662 / NCIMB 1420 / SS-2) TaxID=1122177 RepID=A0A2D0NEE8_FLAN2|nr:sulfatase [Flavilitoribacter nigricans]PHN06559.1 sulfatase [Flavilitoribacter nigricans DSM 23189 = NBRC 102662]
MKKRIINACFYLFILLVLSSCGSRLPGSEAARPNILFIMSDDHAAHAISAYGGIYDEYAPTPNIDRLAREGVLFRNVFCTNAICGPSRAAVLTGKYSHVNGYYKNEGGGQFNAEQWTFPQALQDNGYQTALVGKWHLGTEPRGFDYFKYHNNPGQQGFYWDPVYNENGKEVTEEGYATNLTTDFALEWLTSQRDQDQPFAMLLQYKAPHRNWEPDRKYEDLWEETEMPYPSTFDDDYAGREKTAGDTDMTMDFFNRKDMKLTPPEELAGRELRRWNTYGNKRGQNVKPDSTMSDAEARRWKYQTYIKDYLACVKSVDDNIGRVLQYLDENGLAENTIVVYTSDQGFYLGEHGWFDKRFIYEESLRMPFLVRYPAKVKAGQENTDIITNVDFAPTLLEAAGITPPAAVQGRSFLANLSGKTPQDWPQAMYYHYYEYPFWHHVQPHYGIRNDRYKLAHFYYDIDVWEFYDLEKDPQELNNAIDDPANAAIIEDMKTELRAMMAHYGNDRSLEELREITTKDFGHVTPAKVEGSDR